MHLFLVYILSLTNYTFSGSTDCWLDHRVSISFFLLSLLNLVCSKASLFSARLPFKMCSNLKSLCVFNFWQKTQVFIIDLLFARYFISFSNFLWPTFQVNIDKICQRLKHTFNKFLLSVQHDQRMMFDYCDSWDMKLGLD